MDSDGWDVRLDCSTTVLKIWAFLRTFGEGKKRRRVGVKLENWVELLLQ
jgi:hypothetical protein